MSRHEGAFTLAGQQTPEEVRRSIGRANVDRANQFGTQFSQAFSNPKERALAQIGASFGSGFGGAIANRNDPRIEQAKNRQSILSNVNLSNADSVQTGSEAAAGSGDQQLSLELSNRAQVLKAAAKPVSAVEVAMFVAGGDEAKARQYLKDTNITKSTMTSQYRNALVAAGGDPKVAQGYLQQSYQKRLIVPKPSKLDLGAVDSFWKNTEYVNELPDKEEDIYKENLLLTSMATVAAKRQAGDSGASLVKEMAIQHRKFVQQGAFVDRELSIAYGRNNYSLNLQSLLGASSEPLNNGQQGTNNPAINSPTTQEEFDGLPSGSIYIDPADGKQYRK